MTGQSARHLLGMGTSLFVPTMIMGTELGSPTKSSMSSPSPSPLSPLPRPLLLLLLVVAPGSLYLPESTLSTSLAHLSRLLYDLRLVRS